MKRIKIQTVAFLLCVQNACPVFSACGPELDNEVSDEASRIIFGGEVEKMKAISEIDRRTAQKLLERIFDLKTGRQKRLPPELLDQYQKDAAYFSDKLAREANEASIKVEEILAKTVPCG